MNLKNHKRRGVSELLGIVVMLAIVVTLGVLIFSLSTGGMGALSQSYAAAMANKANGLKEKFAVEQVAYAFGTAGVLALDGSATGTFSTTNTGPVTLTTTTSNDIIVVLVTNENGPNALILTVSSVTSPGLTFVERGSPLSIGNPSYQDTEVWWALASSALTAATITVTLTGSTDDAAIVAFGVSGANTASPWDTNGALPATATGLPSTTPSVSGVSTSNANDMILGFQGNGNNAGVFAIPETIGAGFTMIQDIQNSNGMNADDGSAEYQLVSSTQSGVSVGFGTAMDTNNYWMAIADAIRASPAPVQGADVYVRNVGLSPITLVSVYVVDQTSSQFIAQVALSTVVNVGTVVKVPYTTDTFTPTHGHTYSFTVTTSLGSSVVYNAGAL